MSTSVVSASIQLSDGTTVDLFDASMTESTATTVTQELKTSTTYAVAATSVGTFADGKSIMAFTSPITGSNNILYAYLARRGEILSILPIATRGVISQPSLPFRPVVLQAGDTIQVCAMATATRGSAYQCITNAGVHAIFAGLDASGNVDLTHILSGQGIGSSLTGQQIVKHFANQRAASAALNISGNGVYVLNDRGLPAGACVMSVTANQQIECNNMGTALIGLNFVARVSSSA